MDGFAKGTSGDILLDLDGRTEGMPEKCCGHLDVVEGMAHLAFVIKSQTLTILQQQERKGLQNHDLNMPS